jgi:peptidoglycan/LPS O-acetylase OafA/YrhL
MGMRTNYVNLDLLRSTAVLLVLVCHLVMVLGHLDDPLSAQWGIRQLAQLGVLIFFIHTSLVLMMSLDRMDGHGNETRRFYVRRAFRIYPLAMLTVGATLLFRIPPHFEPTYAEPTAGAVWQNLLLVQNLFHSPDLMGPMWSLPLEVQMYLVLPFLYIAARRIKSYSGAAALLLAGFGIWYLDSHAARFFGYQPVVEYAPWFFMGVAAFGLYGCVTHRLPAGFYVALLALFVIAPCVTQRLMPDDYRAGWLMWASGVAFAVALPHFREIRSAVVARIAHTVATYSYGIYLSHVPIMWLAFQKLSDQPRLLQAAVFLALMLTVPPLLYHLVEEPLIRIGRRVSDRMTDAQAQSASALA